VASAPAAALADEDSSARIAKVMARAGLCSRRDAEQWITDGRVSVNGVVLTSPALNVKPRDQVVVDGQPLAAAEPTRLFAFHKPRGTVTTDRDPEGRATIFEVLPPGLPRVMTIGRLDINTEGLLLLTNDGGLARQLELPATGWLRRYRVRAHGETDQAVLDGLREGITIEGVNYAGIEATIDRVQGSNMWLTMGLREGKNREIKRVLEHLGLSVTRLIRISFGPFQLLDLAEGAVEEVKTRVLKDQLGEALTAEAGCVFADEAAPAVVRPSRSFEARPRSEADRREGRAPRARPSEDRGERRPTRDLPRDQDFIGEAEDPSSRPLPGARKHVHTLRAQRDVEQRTGPRQKITRDMTQDRNGRAVTVERVAKPSIRLPAEPESRNGKRFAKGNATREEAPRRGRTLRQSDYKPEDTGPKPFNKPFRKPREDDYDDRPRTGRTFEKRQLSSRSYAGKDGDAPRARSFGAKSEGRSFDKPVGGGKSFGAKSFGAKPAGGRSYDKPAGERPAGGRSFDKPSGGRPDSRPSGGRPAGGRPSGGSQPFGGKPSGGRGR